MNTHNSIHNQSGRSTTHKFQQAKNNSLKDTNMSLLGNPVNQKKRNTSTDHGESPGRAVVPASNAMPPERDGDITVTLNNDHDPKPQSHDAEWSTNKQLDL